MFYSPPIQSARDSFRPADHGLSHEPVAQAPTPQPDEVAAMLSLVQGAVSIHRRVVRAGDVIYRSGDAFDALHVLSAGICKLVNVSSDGREQIVSIKFRGDWMGFDGIGSGTYNCNAVALDTGEVWTIKYSAVLAGCAAEPALVGVLHVAMSKAIVGDRDSLMSVCTLSADARVADFLRYWATALAERGMRYDRISLRMTRADIGGYLGLTLETVSRALSRLARANLIAFNERGRRDICIPDVAALSAFVQRSVTPAAALH